MSRWTAMVAALMAAAAVAAPTEAATSQHAVTPSYQLGAFTGSVVQHTPRSFTGSIRFTVRRGALSALNFTVGALCGKLWVTEVDSLPVLTVPIGGDGGFFFYGTVHRRQIRLWGTLKGNRATGKLLTSFMWGSLSCSMGQPASFTATATS